jgi:hypothetical protein
MIRRVLDIIFSLTRTWEPRAFVGKALHVGMYRLVLNLREGQKTHAVAQIRTRMYGVQRAVIEDGSAHLICHFLDDTRIQKQLPFHLHFNELPLSPRYVTILYNIPVRLRPSCNSHRSIAERVVSFFAALWKLFLSRRSSTRSCCFPHDLPTTSHPKPSLSFLLVLSRVVSFSYMYSCYVRRIVFQSHRCSRL